MKLIDQEHRNKVQMQQNGTHQLFLRSYALFIFV